MFFSKKLKDDDFIKKLDVSFDLLRIQADAWKVIKKHELLEHKEIKQIMVTCRDSDKDPDFDGVGKQDQSVSNEEYQRQFNRLNPTFKGTYFEEVLKAFPYEYGRVRLMLLNERRCYSVHKDQQPRYHLAVWTDPESYLLYKGYPTWFHIPSDGSVYLVHTRESHTAINAGTDMRVHLVFDAVAGY